MRHPLKIVTDNGQEIILNEDNICSVRRLGNSDEKVVIWMANGEAFTTASHPWDTWDNDRILRKD